MAVYKILEELAQERHLSIADISKICNLPDSTVRGIFRRKQETIELEVAFKLSDGLGISLEKLNGMPEKPLPTRDTKKAPPYSSEARKLADAYDNKLDLWGKQAVRELVETEVARCEDESRFLTEDPLQKEEPKVINLYVEPSAAGIATPTMGRDYDLYELKPEDPQGAAYAVRLQGDSMEPYFPDGSIVFVNHDVLRDGEVGIFCVDGGTVCKQYHKEGGIVYLFSLNRKRQDADVILFPEGNRSFICQGRVMTRQRFPVPGR